MMAQLFELEEQLILPLSKNIQSVKKKSLVDLQVRNPRKRCFLMYFS